MLQIHCQTNSPFANIMETIEETAETFCQVSADCKVISGRTRTANQSDLFQNVFPIIDQYLDSCSKLHSDLKIVSLSLGNFFQSLEQLSSHIADTKGKKFKRFFSFLLRGVIVIRPQQSYWREFTSSPGGSPACYPGTSGNDQVFPQQNDLPLTGSVRTIPG